jgi:hypothetical protein
MAKVEKSIIIVQAGSQPLFLLDRRGLVGPLHRHRVVGEQSRLFGDIDTPTPTSTRPPTGSWS